MLSPLAEKVLHEGVAAKGVSLPSGAILIFIRQQIKSVQSEWPVRT
jgi:hypothetical protein